MAAIAVAIGSVPKIRMRGSWGWGGLGGNKADRSFCMAIWGLMSDWKVERKERLLIIMKSQNFALYTLHLL